MDDELRNYLAAMEARLKAEMHSMEERFAALVAGEVGNLHTEMTDGFARVEARFDSIDARLKLQAGLIQAGSRAMARFSEFAENSEERWVKLEARIGALERRLGPEQGNGKQ